MPRNLNIWYSRFAWLPTRLDDGRLVWFSDFEEMQTVITYAPRCDQACVVVRRRLPRERFIP